MSDEQENSISKKNVLKGKDFIVLQDNNQIKAIPYYDTAGKLLEVVYNNGKTLTGKNWNNDEFEIVGDYTRDYIDHLEKQQKAEIIGTRETTKIK